MSTSTATKGPRVTANTAIILEQGDRVLYGTQMTEMTVTGTRLKYQGSHNKYAYRGASKHVGLKIMPTDFVTICGVTGMASQMLS